MQAGVVADHQHRPVLLAEPPQAPHQRGLPGKVQPLFMQDARHQRKGGEHQFGGLAGSQCRRAQHQIDRPQRRRERFANTARLLATAPAERPFLVLKHVIRTCLGVAQQMQPVQWHPIALPAVTPYSDAALS